MRREAVIMASLSREKSLKWNSSIPSSLLRGILAAWESKTEKVLGKLTNNNRHQIYTTAALDL